MRCLVGHHEWPEHIVGLYNGCVDVDRREIAEQLDDAVVGLRRLTLDRRELSLTAAATLTTLRRSGPARLTDLAVTEGISQPSMTALVARLADQGLVQRGTDPGDRRAVLIAVTPAGADLLDRRRAARAGRLTGPLGDLPDDDVRAIAAALPALARLAGVLSHS
jgi:DNA-binding MarR family transcriptional regulator